MICEHCSREFTPRNRTDRPVAGRFCSRACYSSALREAVPTKSCESCGQPFTTHPSRIKVGHGRFCSVVCANASRPVLKAKYRGGGKQGQFHVRAATKALGKPLPPKSQVHHVDGDGLNNKNTNLVICQDLAYHKLLHARTRIVRAGGNPNTQRICGGCKRLRAIEQMAISRGVPKNYCRECCAKLTELTRRARGVPHSDKARKYEGIAS